MAVVPPIDFADFHNRRPVGAVPPFVNLHRRHHAPPFECFAAGPGGGGQLDCLSHVEIPVACVPQRAPDYHLRFFGNQSGLGIYQHNLTEHAFAVEPPAVALWKNRFGSRHGNHSRCTASVSAPELYSSRTGSKTSYPLASIKFGRCTA